MEKKNQANKKPTQADLKKLMALGNMAEKSFKKESLTKIQEKEGSASGVDTLPGPSVLSADVQTVPEVLPETIKKTVADMPSEENADLVLTEKHIEPEQQKNKEELTIQGTDVPFDVFLKKYLPKDTDKRETVWVYTNNLKIIKAIATSEDAPMIDIVNNIIAEWAKKYNKNIRKSLQKPSKMFDF